MSDETRRLIEAYDEAWNRQDLDALCAFHADDVVFENHTAGERAEGADAVRAHIGGIFERWPSLRFRGRRLYAADDFAVSEWTATATRDDGTRIEWDGVDVFPLRDGKIARKDVYSTSHARRASLRLEDAAHRRARGRGRRVASTVPPAAVTTCFTIARPRPVPREARAASARQKRSNRRGRSAAATPIPSSAAVEHGAPVRRARPRA